MAEISMAQDNDSFIREVNEELRSDRFQSIWGRFSGLIIGAAVLIVVGTGGAGVYEYWNSGRASDSGDQFLAALKLASENRNDEALAAFAELEKAGHGAYPVLARFRAATVEAAKGNADAAIATFSAIGKDKSAADVLRDAARVRAALLLVDKGSYEQVSAEVEALAAEGQALRYSAREALGLSAYKAGDFAKARDWFRQIAGDAQAPRNIANRAQIMLDNIAASGKAPVGQG